MSQVFGSAKLFGSLMSVLFGDTKASDSARFPNLTFFYDCKTSPACHAVVYDDETSGTLSEVWQYPDSQLAGSDARWGVVMIEEWDIVNEHYYATRNEALTALNAISNEWGGIPH